MARLSLPADAFQGASVWGSGLAGLQAESLGYFTNPLYRGADPWVIRHDGSYYACHSGPGNRLEVWKSSSLTRRGECGVVWSPPRRGWNRAQVWAPELHRVRGRWYIYYAASDGFNVNHRMGVLEAATDDPQGPYIDRGMLYTGDHLASGKRSRWAIDGTVLDLNGQLYFIWSGWEDYRDVQHLYVARMSDPCTISSDRVQICPNNCHHWERLGDRHHERGLHEAPQLLVRNGRVMLVYSCSGSWQPTYKLGMLYMDASADPMAPHSWTKHNAPVFQSTPDVFGVGHCCFTHSPDGAEDWILYHSKTRQWDGWSDRVVRAQKFAWRPDGFPDFGSPAPSGARLAMPSERNRHGLLTQADPAPDLITPRPAA